MFRIFEKEKEANRFDRGEACDFLFDFFVGPIGILVLDSAID
jgi:hypothetical protein